MYKGYLDAFYRKNPDINDSQYHKHLDALLTDSFEFVSSYTKNFRRLGLEANCIIANDKILQNKWDRENRIKWNSTRSILFDQIKSYQPEILWIENLSLFTNEMLKQLRREIKSLKLIIGYHCSPLNSKITDSLNEVDFIITCTPGLKEVFESLGKKTFLVYHGFDADLIKVINNIQEPLRSNFVFSGSLIPGGNFHNARIRLIEQIVRSNVDIDLYVNLENRLKIRTKQFLKIINSFLSSFGLEQASKKIKILDHGRSEIVNYSNILLHKVKLPVFGIDMYNLFRQSKIVLNYHIDVAGASAGNMRMFEVTGAGSCLLTDNKKNIGDLFEPDKEIIVYDNPDDCIEKVKWLLNNENDRKRIALNGQQRTLKYHTVQHRCETIIGLINQELKYLH
jgi:hypothetical protein